ncbi:hypothetical protein Tco_0245302 [Tanacetum coccineum]
MNTSQDIKMQMVDDNDGNQSIQNVENMNGLSVVLEISNQFGNGNVVTAPAEGNGNGINASTSGTQSSLTMLQELSLTMLRLGQRWIKLNRTKEKLENCIIKKEKEYAVLWNNWYKKYEECKYDKISYDKAYNDMQQKIKRLQAKLGDLKDENVSLESQVLNYAKENAHLKTTYKNLFDSIKLFDKVSEEKVTQKYETNTLFTKQSILGKPPSSSYKPKLYSVTPFPKSLVLPKVDKTNALVDNVVPNKPVKSSIRTKPITASQPNVIHRQPNSNSSGFSPTRVNNTAKTISPQPARVHSKSKSSCPSNNFKKLEGNHRNSLIPKTQKHKSSECNNIKLAVRNAISEVVCAMYAQVYKIGKSKKLKAQCQEFKAGVSGPKEVLLHMALSNTRNCSRWGSNWKNFCHYCNPFFKEKGSVRFSALYLKKKRNLLVFTSVDMIVMTSMVELESLFGHLFDELSNGENQVVSKSSDVTTAMHSINVNNKIQLHLLHL